MSARIIDLGQFRMGVRTAAGITFPEIYRVTGCYWDQDGDTLVPSSRQAPTQYSLNNHRDEGTCDQRFTPIKRLDPAIDSGWIVVRQHLHVQFLEGYVDGMMDFGGIMDFAAFQTKEGLFSVLHRRPPKGAPDHLLLYACKRQIQRGLCAGTWVDAWHIVHPDGTVTDDYDAFFSELPCSEGNER